MKIIIFTENYRGGGMDTFIASLIKNWSNKDEFVVICNHNHPGLGYLKTILSKDVELVSHSLPLNWSFLSDAIKYLPSLLQRVTRQILRVILSPYQYICIKKLLDAHKADQLISVNGGYPGGETCRLANIAFYALYKKRSIHNFHNYAVKNRLIFAPYELLIDSKLDSSCSEIISVSRDCANSIKERYIFKNSKKISFIYNSLYSNPSKNIKSSIKEKYKIANNEKIVLMLGTFEERKGHRYLMNAMTKVFEINSNLHLFLLGSGTKEETLNLKLLISQYRWSHRVHLTGFVEDISQYMSIADILVIPSQENESFGLTAIEAMSYGIPIVSTNIGGLPETIGENGGCGFYTSIDDINGFSNNIINLINDESLAKKMSQNGLNRANEIYSPSRMAKQYMSLLSPDKKI